MQIVLELGDYLPSLAFVHRNCCVEQGGLVVVLACHRAQGRHVLGEARATPADTGAEETTTNALVEADAVGDACDVRADQLAYLGDLVDKADLGREKGVGGVL